MPEVRIPPWAVAVLLATIPGLVVGVIAHQELDSTTMAIIAGTSTTGVVATVLSLVERINR